MDNKNDIKKYNKYLSEFLDDIKGTFPEYVEIINSAIVCKLKLLFIIVFVFFYFLITKYIINSNL